MNRLTPLALMVALSVPLYATAEVTYDSQVITFSDKTTNSITLSNGWSLASLTKTDGTTLDFMTSGTVPSITTYFTPNINAGSSSGGPWIATFNAPEDGVILDGVTFDFITYKANGDVQPADAGSISFDFTVSYTTIGGQTVTLDTRSAQNLYGTANAVPGNAIQAFSFDAPQCIKQIVLKADRNTNYGSGCYVGLSKITLGQYTNAEAIYEIKETLEEQTAETTNFTRTGNTLSMDNGWSFDTTSATDFTFKNDNNIANLYFAPDVNVGSGTPWTATFIPDEPLMMNKVSIDFCIYNSSGQWQGYSTNRDFIVTLYDANDNQLATTGNITIEGSETDTPENNSGTQVLTFTARTLSALKIKVEEGSDNAGCYIGMKSFTVTPVTQTLDIACTETLVETPATANSVLVLNDTAWPTETETWGAIYASTTLPALTDELPATQTANVLKCAGSSITLDGSALTTQEEATLIAATTVYPSGLTAMLTGFAETAPRPGASGYGAQITAEADLVLANVVSNYVSPTGVAVLYADAGGAALSDGWWYSTSAGAIATQMSFADAQAAGATQGLIWLDGGMVTIDAETTIGVPVTIQADGTGNALAIAEETTLTFTPSLAPYVTNPMITGDVSLKLGGTLEMAGDLMADVVLTSASARIQLPEAPVATTNTSTAYMASGNDQVDHPVQGLTLYGKITAEGDGALTLGNGVVLVSESVTAPVTLDDADLTLGGDALGALTVSGTQAEELTLCVDTTLSGLTLNNTLDVTGGKTLTLAGSLAGNGTVSALTLANGASITATETATPTVTELSVAEEDKVTVEADCGVKVVKFETTNAEIADFAAANGVIYKANDHFYLGVSIGDPTEDSAEDAAAAVIITDAVKEAVEATSGTLADIRTITIKVKDTKGDVQPDVTATEALTLFNLEPTVVIDGDVATVTVSYDFAIDSIRVVEVSDGYTVELSAMVDGGVYTDACKLELIQDDKVIEAEQVKTEANRRAFRVSVSKDDSGTAKLFKVRATTKHAGSAN